MTILSKIPQKIKPLEFWAKLMEEQKEVLELPEKVESYNELRDDPVCLFSKYFSFNRGFLSVSLARRSIFTGTWFKYKKEDGSIGQVILTPDKDFVDNEYNSVEIPDSESLKFVSYENAKRIPNFNEIMSDFMISRYLTLKRGYVRKRRTCFVYINGAPDRQYYWNKNKKLSKIVFFDKFGFEKAIYYIPNNKSFTITGIKDRVAGDWKEYKMNGEMIDGMMHEAEIIDFGKFKQKKDRRQKKKDKYAVYKQNKQYRWLVTYNKPAEDELKIIGYYPQKLWYTNQKRDIKDNAKEYLSQMGEELNKEGTLTMWKLKDRNKKIKRHFEPGETVDVAEIDTAPGQYDMYAVEYIKSHLRLVHY